MIDDLARGILTNVRDADQFFQGSGIDIELRINFRALYNANGVLEGRPAVQDIMRQRAGDKDRRHKKEDLLFLFGEMQHGTNNFKGEIERERGSFRVSGYPGNRLSGNCV